MLEKPQTYAEMKEQTGFTIAYLPREDGSAAVEALSAISSEPIIAAAFTRKRIDEGHILFTEVTELLSSRAALHQNHQTIRSVVEKLFAAFRGEKVSFADQSEQSAGVGKATPNNPGEFVANPGKQLDIEVDGVTYRRLPIRTRLITLKDTNIIPILSDYAEPHLQAGDLLFISEKALTITQGRVVDMSTIKPNWLARFLARNVGNNYGSSDFRGFGHGTALAMQLFLEEAGYLRVLAAAMVSALTRPLGIRGLFYRICGKRAKSIDCPMSFLILEYAHSAKLAPNNPKGVARQIKKRFGAETVILDANYRGAFSLGKSTSAISESFIGKLFRDNPLGQSDEMTPFCIVRTVPSK
jgi:hypothetical protein